MPSTRQRSHSGRAASRRNCDDEGLRMHDVRLPTPCGTPDAPRTERGPQREQIEPEIVPVLARSGKRN